MSALLPALIVLAALGCGLIAGVFFAFSTFVMTALGRLPPREGIAAMQSINIVVINPWFLGVFFGSAVPCVALAVLGSGGQNEVKALCFVAGAILYVVGTLFVTVAFNVPLNNALAKAVPDTGDAAALWARYLVSWTMWNHVRTAAALLASAAFVVAAYV